LIVLSLAVAVIAPLLLSAPTPVRAQNRRIMLEEYTGAWCGWCVRGALAIQKLDEKYPGQVIPVAIHGPVSYGEPMSTAQGDSLNSGIGFPVSDQYGWPDGWTARTVETAHNDWNVDPDSWIDTTNATGIVDGMVNQPAQANATIDQVTFDPQTHLVTARVSAKFNDQLSGDFRLNLYVVEDSVQGNSDPAWVQHNYYYHNASFPTSPYYNQGDAFLYQGQPDGSTIANYTFMHVFREAVGGVHGVKGPIPASPTSGTTYSQVFSFYLPVNVLNPNHAKLIGFVHQYSATDMNANQILDAAEVPLTTTTLAVAPNNLEVTGNDGQYLIAHANGDMTTTLSVANNGTDAVTVNLAVPANSLPAGWSMTFDPASVSVDGGGQKTVSVKVTAPNQSAYIVAPVLLTPQKTGEYIPGLEYQFAFVSDNTNYAAYSYGGESAAVNGMPDTMRLHTAYIPLNANTLAYYDPVNSGLPIALAMFLNDPVLDGSESVTGGPSVLSTITSALAAGERVYISSNDAMAWAWIGNASTTTDAVQSFFSDTLGTSWKKNISRINSNNQYTQFRIDGTTDPIGAGLANLTANTTGSISGDGETPTFNVTAGGPSTSLFYVDNAKASNVSLKTQFASGDRLVYMGFALDALSNQVKADTIFRRSIQWLMGGATVAPPAGLTLSASSLDFGVVSVGGSLAKYDTITNSSNTSITINSITVNPTSANFSFSGFSVPITLDPGASKKMLVIFAPTTDGNQSASLVVNYDDNKIVNVHVQGTTSSSGVHEDGTASASLAASPNPFHGLTQIQYTAGAGEQGVSLAAYDLLGREVAKLTTQNAGGSLYTALFDGSKLANGTYIIVAHSSTGTHEVRVLNQQ